MSQTALSRREQHARTRAELLDAAGRVFARRGLERASIDEIAAEAGYTKGAFYASFDSKEDLFLEIVDVRFADETARLDAMLGGGEDPEGQVRAAAIDFLRFVHTDPEWSRLFFEFTVRASREPKFREHLGERYDVLRARLVDVYRRWTQELGVDSPVPLEEIATMTYCMANGFLAEQLIDPSVPDGVYGSMMAIFVRGLQGMAEDREAGARPDNPAGELPPLRRPR
jgi:AcrR family transcriptional regulator